MKHWWARCCACQIGATSKRRKSSCRSTRYGNEGEIEDSHSLQKWSELIDLYHGKDLHRKALLLLTKYLKTSSHPIGGIHPTIQYLRKLGPEHIELILEFSVPILQMDAAEALGVWFHRMLELFSLTLTD